MFYIFEMNTDSRYGIRKMIKTSSKKVAQRYLETKPKFAFPELATNEIPGYSQNWHRTIYQVYEHNGRLPLREIKKELKEREKHYRHSMYRHSVSLEGEIATFLHQYGTRL